MRKKEKRRDERKEKVRLWLGGKGRGQARVHETVVKQMSRMVLATGRDMAQIGAWLWWVGMDRKKK